MSLKGWIIRREASAALKDAEQGKDGPEMQATVDWVRTHKAFMGKAIGAVVVVLGIFGYTKAAAVGASVASFLAGAGYIDSDAYHKAQQQ